MQSKETNKLKTVLNELTQIEDIQTLYTMYNNKDYSIYSESELIAEWERRKAIKDAAEAKKLTTVDKLTFITANDPEYFKYDIDSMFQKSFDKALTRALPYTHFSDGHNYKLKTFRIDYEKTISANAASFEQFVISCGITIPDFKLYYYCHSLLDSYYFRQSDEGKSDQYSMSSNGYNVLAQFIMFLVDGAYCKDYTEANKFLDEQKISYSTQSTYAYTYGNISVKRFANGRLDIKGLTETQKYTIKKVFDIHQTLRNK